MKLSNLLIVACAYTVASAPSRDTQQTRLHEQEDLSDKGLEGIRAALIKAEVIPTVLDDFMPSLQLHVSWRKNPNATAELGNLLNPKDLKDQPFIYLFDDPTIRPSTFSHHHHHKSKGMHYAVALTDPDAPSRDNPEWSEMCHWIAYNVPLIAAPSDTETNTDTEHRPSVNKNKKYKQHLKKIMPYKPPGPPPKTGKHRYVFVAFAPANGSTKKLHLSKPKDRQHWGFKTGGYGGVRDWATENGLEAIGANFVYAENDKQ